MHAGDKERSGAGSDKDHPDSVAECVDSMSWRTTQDEEAI